MKAPLHLLAVLAVALTACQKEDVTSQHQSPTGDPANNVCVVSAVMDAERDINASECGSGGQDFYSESYLNQRVNLWAGDLEHGISGTRYKVLDKGWTRLASSSCGSASGFSYVRKAELWVKYDCRGVGVDVKIFGPYPYSALTIKTQEHTSEVQAQGYKVAYVSQDRVTQDANVFYLTFYVYKPDPSTPAGYRSALQRSVVESLKDARTFNRATLASPNRALSDTLSRAVAIDPSIQNRNDYQLARQLLEMLDQLRRR